MRFQRHRKRLILVSLLLTLLSGLILIGISYWNTSGVGTEIHLSAQKNITRHMESQLMAKFNEISTLATQLESHDFIDYAREYYNLRDPELAEQVKAVLIDRLNRLHLQPELVEQVYFIGENKNQKSFGQSFRDGTVIEEAELPWIDDLRTTGLLDLLTGISDMPTYIPSGLLTDKLTALEDLPDDRRHRLQSFVERIEGRLIVNNGINMLNVLSILVLDRQIFSITAPVTGGWQGFIAVMDNHDHLLWTNLPFPEVAAAAMEQRGIGNPTWSEPLERMYDIRSDTVAPYGLELLFFEKRTFSVIWDRQLLLVCMLLLVATLAVSLLVSLRFSTIIMQPFHLLSRITWKKERNVDLEQIPATRFAKLPLSQVSIRNKIMLLLLSSVMLPFIAAVALHVVLMYQLMFDRMVESTVQSSNQMTKEIRNRLDSFESLANALSADSRLNNRFLSYPYDAGKNDDFPVSSYPGLVDVSYFVLYNSQGVARYSSTFINNLNLFRLSNAEVRRLEQLEHEQIAWLTGKKDVYNRSAMMLVKKLSLPVSMDGRYMDGYLQVVLKEDVFQSAISDRRESFVLLKPDGEQVYSSTEEQGFMDLALRELGEADNEDGKAAFRKVEASNQIVLQRPVPETDWSAMLFFTMDDIHLKINEMFYRYLLLIVLTLVVIFGVVWRWSAYLVQPIEKLRRRMEQWDGAVGRSLAMTEENPGDEVASLVQSFNAMVVKINELAEENIQKQIREKELVTSKMKAELGMLQQQINPHFLYNTLEAINMRARQYGALEVSAMVNSLARIFRFTINTGHESVMLGEELEHVRNYLTIQSLRFKDAFTVVWEVERVPPETPVLKFILQPIVENALQHGFEEMYETGELRIRTEIDGEQLVIAISDNGLGMDGQSLQQLRNKLQADEPVNAGKAERQRTTGVGLLNVYRRMKIYYGPAFGMEIDSREFAGTTVTMRIPLTAGDDTNKGESV